MPAIPKPIATTLSSFPSVLKRPQIQTAIIDDTFNECVFELALEALKWCEECQQEFKAAQQVRDLLVKLQSANLYFQLSPGFMAKLHISIHQHDQENLNLSNLSVAEFKIWNSLFNR